eukprot:PITA_34615
MKDMDLMHYFLGMEVWQKDGEVFVSQGKYANEILKRFHMDKCKPMQTPLASNWKKEDATSAESSYGLAYQAVLEGNEACTEIPQRHISVWIVVQMDRGSEALGLHRCRLGRESIRPEELFWRYLQPWFNYNFLVQQETEKILMGLFGQRMDPTVIYCDNQSCIKLSENPVFHDRSKHIDIRYHHLRDCVLKRIMLLLYVLTEVQDANILTKALSKCKFEFHRDKIGVTDNPFHVEREC